MCARVRLSRLRLASFYTLPRARGGTAGATAGHATRLQRCPGCAHKRAGAPRGLGRHANTRPATVAAPRNVAQRLSASGARGRWWGRVGRVLRTPRATLRVSRGLRAHAPHCSAGFASGASWLAVFFQLKYGKKTANQDAARDTGRRQSETLNGARERKAAAWRPLARALVRAAGLAGVAKASAVARS